MTVGPQCWGFPGVNRLRVIPGARRQALHYHLCSERTSFIINVSMMDYTRCLRTLLTPTRFCFFSAIQFNWRVCFPPPPDDEVDSREHLMIKTSRDVQLPRTGGVLEEISLMLCFTLMFFKQCWMVLKNDALYCRPHRWLHPAFLH